MSAIKEILVLHHSHFDLGYTHTQPVLWELQRRFIDQAIELCERTADAPEPSRVKWTCEATAPVLHWMKHSSDRQIERFTRLAASGRIAVSAMLCNMTPLYDAEELARSFYPVRELRERFKLPIRVAMNHDVNGIPWPAAEILLDCGVELLVMGINVHFGGFPLHRPLGFQWKTPDGRQLLAYNGEHYGAFERELRLAEKSTAAMATGLDAYLKRINQQHEYPYDFVYLTSTNHGDNSPPDPNLAQMVRRWNDEQREPVIRFATPEMLLERLRRQPAPTIPAHSGDWTDYWNFGAASSARETAINRQARQNLCKAEVLRTVNGRGDDASRRLRDEAWWQVCCYDEHTWGASGSTAAPDEENTAAQWNHKANFAFEARALSGLVLADQLELLAGNSVNTHGVKGVLFTNATPEPVTDFLRMQNAFFDGSWRHITARIEGLSHAEWLNDSNSRIVGPIELPAFGWRVIPIEELIAATVPAGVAASSNTIESPTHKLTFDPATGRITSLYDKQNGWEVIDAASPWPFFSYVQETVDLEKEPSAWPMFQRNALFEHDWKKMFSGQSCWQKDWPAVRRGPTKLLSCHAETSPRGATLVLKFEAPGTDLLEQRITLLAHRAAVEFKADLRKLDVRNAEATYFTFPLNVAANWRAHYDTAGLPVELDAEQLPGVVRDWVTVGQWVAVHDAGHAVTLTCPDAPLVQIGGFNFAQAQSSIPRNEKPLLLAWPMNNYWTTNFKASQPGFMSLRYELATHAGYDAERSTRAALAAVPMDCHPVPAGGSAKTRQALDVSGAGVVALQIKPPESGDGIIVRLTNVSSKATQAVVRIPERIIARACVSTILEEDGAALEVKDGAARVELAPRSIATIRLVLRS